ncbi:hypothetical protein HY625_00860 [Candidatus Uhrbacteria bacterium]|nr:hypothetical protein [Candidatus Uhrbacteria bacterium]
MPTKIVAAIDPYWSYGAFVVYAAMIVGGELLRGTMLGFMLVFAGVSFIYMEMLLLRSGIRGGKVVVLQWVLHTTLIPLCLTLGGLAFSILGSVMHSSWGKILYLGGVLLAFVNIYVMFALCFWKLFQEQRRKKV